MLGLVGAELAAVVGDLDDTQPSRSSTATTIRLPSVAGAVEARAREQQHREHGLADARLLADDRADRKDLPDRRARAARASARRAGARPTTTAARSIALASRRAIASVWNARTLLAMRSAPVVMSSRQRSAAVCLASAQVRDELLAQRAQVEQHRRQRVVGLVREARRRARRPARSRSASSSDSCGSS